MHVNLDLLKTLAERLRAESIGDPQWVSAKNVFEYPDQTVKVAVVLKVIRAAQGVHAMDSLSRRGLFIDMGAIYRCVEDSISEVYFLLEHYPEQSTTVEKFLAEFFSHTIDSDLSASGERVLQRKIHSAVIRCLTGKEQDAQLKLSLTRIFRTYSGYVHSGYAHIMEMYGGPASHPSFNISGIHSQEQQGIRMLTVVEAYRSVLFAIGHVAAKFGLEELLRDVRSAC